MDFCADVNVFQGQGELDLPQSEGIAAAWHFIKARSGNTHPGAAVPFGKFTCCAYSGGYSSGYGNHSENCGGSVPRFCEGQRIKGLSHIHNSGTGALGLYWNYCLTTPFFGSLRESGALLHIARENASPGYYSAVMAENGITCEAVVTQKIAVHRYRFPEGDGRISIELSANGLDSSMPKNRHTPQFARLRLESDAVEAEMNMEGLPIYVYAHLCGTVGAARLWLAREEIEESTLCLDSCPEAFGVVFNAPAGVQTLELRVGISSISLAIARQQVNDEIRAFDAIRQDNRALWNRYLGAVEIETDDKREREIFYSNLYHSLIKPCDWSGESCFYDGDAFTLDFVTLWDQYKTQLPLLFTLYPDISRKIVETYLHFSRSHALLPHTVCLTSNLNIEAKQARMLGVYVLLDAYFRSPESYDKRSLLDAMLTELQRAEFADFRENGTCAKITHTLDMAEACRAMALFAEDMGNVSLCAALRAYAESVRHCFDPATGLLFADSDYYEGNHWNYSFRLLHNMEERIALCGKNEDYVALLDRFFGFTHPLDTSGRFEGFNNETDMEAPYDYLFAGRHDRLCEVIDSSLRYMFTTGRGGLPGNNDSGGLSSCYIWNALGIFPVSGQDLMLLGTPRFPRALLHLANGRELVIEKQGEGIYVKQAFFDGQALPELRFHVDRMMQGGTLTFVCATSPGSDF